MKIKLKYLGIYILIAIGGPVLASLCGSWFNTQFKDSTELLIGVVLFACISIGVCIGLYNLQKGKDITNDRIRLSKVMVGIIQWGILMASFYGVNGWTIVLLGILIIYLQMIFPLHFAGWVSAVAYPVTYCISSLCDAPTGGNLYVYWALSYIGVVAVAILVDVLLINKKRCIKQQSA